MNAILDLGNSRLKYANLEKNLLIEEYSYNKEDLLHLYLSLKKNDVLYVSTVSISRLRMLLDVLNELELYKDIKILYSQNNNTKKSFSALVDDFKKFYIDFFDITTALQFQSTAHGIGIDRILALNFASSLAESCIVLSLGTAITLDVLKDLMHLGGFILPGFHTQYNSILSGTDIDLDNFELDYNLDPGQRTKDAVLRGIVNSTVLGLEKIISNLSKKHNISKVLITGGDSKALCKAMDEKCKDFEEHGNMVLKGLQKILEGK